MVQGPVLTDLCRRRGGDTTLVFNLLDSILSLVNVVGSGKHDKETVNDKDIR